MNLAILPQNGGRGENIDSNGKNKTLFLCFRTKIDIFSHMRKRCHL